MTASTLLADPGYAELKRSILEHTGLQYYGDKNEDLAARIARRLGARHIHNCAAYLRLLEDRASGEREMDALVSELTIGETYFFRHFEQFQALAQVALPDLIARNRAGRRLRIWSAGCATGAEPYSIALLLAQEFSVPLAGWDVRILGTDINRAFLARAREGRFNTWAFREGPADLQTRYFDRDGKDWVLRREFRSPVSFHYHNLVKDSPPDMGCPIDLILCRNVMIYFSRELVAATVARFRDCLAEGGWLVVGYSEPNPQLFQGFRPTLRAGHTLYQKIAEPQPVEVPPAPIFAPLPAPVEKPAPPLAREPVRRPPAPPATPPTLAEVRTLADRGQWREAAFACRALLSANGLDPAAHFTYALILEHGNPGPTVERTLRRAIYLDRGFALAHYHLGLWLYGQRSFEQSRRAFRNVLEILRHRGLDESLEHGDGITVAELKQLAQMHLELAEQA